MTALEDAVKAAAEALSEYYEGDGWGYFGGAAEAAVAAAAPILLAEKDAEIERLQAVVEYEKGGWDYCDAEVAKSRSALAAERARIAAAIQADANFEPSCEHDIGFYDGLMRAARIAETAPEEGS